MSNLLVGDTINVPKMFTDLFEGPFDAEKAENVASNLGISTENYDNQVLAGRLLIFSITRSCKDVNSYVDAYKHRLNPNIAAFMLQYADELNAAMSKNEHLEYQQHDYFSARCLIKQYLLRTSYDEEPLESIQMMHMRQAIQFYHHIGITQVLKCYEELSNQHYTHASPTVFNAGTNQNQESSCFKIKVADNMDDISDAVHTISSVSKMNGGIGICVDELRHSSIGDVGVSEGPLGFLGIYDKTINKVNQGGKRNGAATAFLQSWHYDFDGFVKATNNFMDHTQRFGDLNTCAWMSDLLYIRIQNAAKADRLKKDGKESEIDPSLKTYWTMFCPKKAEVLRGLYGIDFIRRYEEVEKLADKREEEYTIAINEVKRLHSILISDVTDENRKNYLRAREIKKNASKHRIEHKKIDAYQLYKSIIETQTNSGMPYMMNADACQKSNQKNIGSIDQSNLCLEILEVTKSRTKNEDPEIASCNLASMNLSYYVRDKLDWEKYSEYKIPDDSRLDILKAYNFELFSENVHSIVRNLNEVIDHNYYPLDQRDEKGKVTKQGPISKNNLKNRPLGIGVSGQSDALSLMDCPYDGLPHEMFNKMLYACKYFNAQATSMVLAIRDGEYENFRKGSYRRFIGINKTYENGLVADKDGFITLQGSPLSNGQFQFDLWQEEAAMLKAHGLLDEKIYKAKDNEPLDPSKWDQQQLYAYVIPLCNRDKVKNPLEYEIRTSRRQKREFEVEIEIKPTWEELRRLIKLYGVRNSLLIALMPTASSANVLRNCESTEAHQSMIYGRDVKAGNFTILVRHLCKDLQEIGLWSTNLANFIAACEGTIKYIKYYINDHPDDFPGAKLDDKTMKRLDFIIEKYRTMYEISQKFILNLARQRAIYVCQSQSLNIYLKDPTPIQLEAVHIYANHLRLKTGMYYLRQSPAKSAGDFTIPSRIVEYVKKLLGFDKQSGEINKSNEEQVSDSASSDGDKNFSRSISPASKMSNSQNPSPILGSVCNINNKDCVECQS